MKLLTEIVNLLTDNDSQITSSLLKTKVLASRLNNKALSDWVNKEISGYGGEDEIPSYREYGCNVFGTYVNGNTKATNHVISTRGLDKDIREKLDKITFYEGVAALESYLNNQNLDNIKKPIPAELVDLISRCYRRAGNTYFSLFSAYRAVGIGAVEQTISEIRNKLLDLILKLEEEYGFEIDMNELIQKKSEVNQTIHNYMSQTIYNNGDGNFVNTGNNNSIKNKINIKRNDFQSLKKLLQENHVQQSDIDELEEVIVQEPDFERKLFPAPVNNWIQKMISKSLDGTWQVGIGTAGTLLADAITKYYF